MPTATIRPAGDGSHTSSYGHGYGTHTGPGACPLTDSSSGLYPYCNTGALYEPTFVYLRSRTAAATANPGRLEFSWDAVPSGIVVTSIAMSGYLRLASVGGSYWSADCSLYGFVNIGGTRYAGTTVVMDDAVVTNTNASGPTGTFLGPLALGTWAVSPATGVTWTLSELAAGTFLAGVAADSPNVPDSNGGAAGHHVGMAGVEILVTYTVSSTATEPLRRVASHALRMRSYA